MHYPSLMLDLETYLLLQVGKQVHISIIKQTIMEILSPLARLELMRDMFGIMITLYMRLIVV